MAPPKRPDTEIADGFVHTMKTIADSHGLTCESAKFKGMVTAGGYKNTLVLFEGEGDTEKVRWLLYYKVSSAPNPDFWWGLTGKILNMMREAASRRGAQWAVVLLAGSSHRGYLLEAKHVERGTSRWSYRPQDDQFKVVAKYLDSSNSLHFTAATTLASFLELSKPGA